MQLKLAIARRQLGTALALFLDDKDPVSVHCLACGGGELAYRLAQSNGGQPWIDSVLTHNPAARLQELLSHRNQFWNAMKHATGRDGKLRSDDELLAQFSDEMNDELLFIAFYDFAFAFGSLPVEAHVYMFWFLARYPDVVGPPNSNNTEDMQTKADVMFPRAARMPRHKAKAQLRRVIERQRKDRDVMAHVRTDRRQLILGRMTHPLDEDILPLSSAGDLSTLH